MQKKYVSEWQRKNTNEKPGKNCEIITCAFNTEI